MKASQRQLTRQHARLTHQSLRAEREEPLASRLWLCGQQQCVPLLYWRVCTESQIDLEPRQI